MAQLFNPYGGRRVGKFGFGGSLTLAAMLGSLMPNFSIPIFPKQVVMEHKEVRFTAEDWQLFEYRAHRNRRNKIAKASRKRNRQ